MSSGGKLVKWCGLGLIFGGDEIAFEQQFQPMAHHRANSLFCFSSRALENLFTLKENVVYLSIPNTCQSSYPAKLLSLIAADTHTLQSAQLPSPLVSGASPFNSQSFLNSFNSGCKMLNSAMEPFQSCMNLFLNSSRLKLVFLKRLFGRNTFLLPKAECGKCILLFGLHFFSDADPGQRDPVLWLQQINKYTWTTEILWRKRDSMATLRERGLERAQESADPRLERLLLLFWAQYGMVLIYYAQVHCR